MLTWGVKVNEYGNAELDDAGDFIKLSTQGVSDGLWNEMVAFAKDNGLKGGNYKKLNLPFENKLLRQSAEIRERMIKGVEDFVYKLLSDVFNAENTAPIAIDLILEAGSYDLGPKATRIEDPDNWTEKFIREKVAHINTEKGPKGDFDD